MTTIRKLYDGSRAVPSCPDRVISFVNDGINTDSELARLLVRFCADPQMECVWAAMRAKDSSDIDCVDALVFWMGSAAHMPGDTNPFYEKTNPERLAWLDATRKAARTLKSLLDEGPTLDAENVVQCIPLKGMRWILGLMGVRIVPGDTSRPSYNEADNIWEVSKWSVKRTQEGTAPLWLSDLLDMLLSELDKGVPSTQTISKPRDAKAFRARYILQVSELMESNGPVRLTDEQLAALASVALEDETITPGLANRFRWRPSKSAPVGAV